MPYCGRQPLAYLRREVPDGREPRLAARVWLSEIPVTWLVR